MIHMAISLEKNLSYSKMKIRKITLTISFVFITTFVFSQVGINTPVPDTSAVLDMSGPANRLKGLLLPAVIDTVSIPDGKVLINSATAADGLLVFDPKEDEFYFWDKAKNNWFSLNRWKAANNDTIITTNNKVKIDSTLEVVRNINTSSKLQESGADLVPRGAIMMWSGTVAPAGWHLCDGSTGVIGENGNPITIPDLRGRFIVGLGGTYAINSTGGAETITLNAGQVPLRRHSHEQQGTFTTATDGAHRHAIDSYAKNNGGNHARRGHSEHSVIHTKTDGIHSHSFTISGPTAETEIITVVPHENRPPYYTLAYIIKL